MVASQHYKNQNQASLLEPINIDLADSEGTSFQGPCLAHLCPYLPKRRDEDEDEDEDDGDDDDDAAAAEEEEESETCWFTYPLHPILTGF